MSLRLDIDFIIALQYQLIHSLTLCLSSSDDFYWLLITFASCLIPRDDDAHDHGALLAYSETKYQQTTKPCTITKQRVKT